LNKLNFYNHITLGEALTETWRHKREIGGVTSARLDNQFREALAAGAHGGKLCGAGGGGCWFFIVSPVDRPRVKKALGLAEIPFSIGGSIQEFAL
jgi:D-glycero-alpha-D-manno-heptose-7-phosphate kinase